MPPSYSKAEVQAIKVLEECGLDEPTGFPIETIIRGRGCSYEEKLLTGKEGEIVSFHGQSTITINSSIDFLPKKRFAQAHELGHYELHRDILPMISDTEYNMVSWFQSNPHEKEANEFAAEFLMPTEIFRKECNGDLEPDLIDYLSDGFDVSKTAAMLKFVKCGHVPVGLIYCKDNKMGWFKATDDFKEYIEFDYGMPPPFGTVAFEMFNTKNSYYGHERMQDVYKSCWLKLKHQEQDNMIKEFCLFVPSYNYSLSLIWLI